MAAASHNPSFAKKAGIPVSVAKEFNQADKGKKFKEGGNVANLKKMFKGKETYSEELKEGKAIKSGKLTPQQYAKGEKMEDSKKMKADDKKMKSGGSCYAKGGVTRADGCATKGHTKGKMMAEGGRVGRGDGIASWLETQKENEQKRLKNLPEMMRRKTAAETDAGKGEGILQKLRSPYQSGEDTEYNKRNSAVQKKSRDEYEDTKSGMAANALGIKSSSSDSESKPKAKPSVSKPKKPVTRAKTEGQKAREQIERMRELYNSDSSTAEDMNTQGKLDAAEDSGMKRGGKVKSCGMKGGGVTRGDGIASRGRTRGKFV